MSNHPLPTHPIRSGLACALACTLLLAGLAVAQAPDRGGLSIQDHVVTWAPAVEAAAFTLTVSGPGEFHHRVEFAAGEGPEFSAFDRDGYSLPDGVYAYELLVTPRLGGDVLDAMAEARALGDDGFAAALRQEGFLPSEARVYSGYLRIAGGGFVRSDAPESGPARVSSAGVVGVSANDQVIVDDLIVDGSICAGQDCVNGESFGFDTLRLKENNLRIKFQDTSSSASFPTQDWQLTANDSSNGGADRFSIEAIAPISNTPFTIEAGARNNALYVEADGDIGIGTNNPAVDLHIKTGDTPTLRLEQDGSSGFTAQTYDVAANEANFFVRDVTNGSRLFFRSKPGAPENSIFIAADGDVGLGTENPSEKLDVINGNIRVTGATDPKIVIEDTTDDAGDRPALVLKSPVSTAGGEWRFQTDNGGQFQIDFSASAGPELLLSDTDSVNSTLTINGAANINGVLNANGGLTVTGGCTGCDAVFTPEFELESIEEHAALMWGNSYLPGVGPTPEGTVSIDVFQKTTGILQELEKAHIYIDQLHQRLSSREEQLDTLSSELASLKAQLGLE